MNEKHGFSARESGPFFTSSSIAQQIVLSLLLHTPYVTYVWCGFPKPDTDTFLPVIQYIAYYFSHCCHDLSPALENVIALGLV